MTVTTNVTFDKSRTSLGLHVHTYKTVCDAERGWDESFQSQKAVWNLRLFIPIKIRKILEEILRTVVHPDYGLSLRMGSLAIWSHGIMDDGTYPIGDKLKIYALCSV